MELVLNPDRPAPETPSSPYLPTVADWQVMAAVRAVEDVLDLLPGLSAATVEELRNRSARLCLAPAGGRALA